ncbi:nitroreductase family protein [Verrucosispora sp. WMMA2044]|uniref:Nitroreductase family protein n=1 Tax=Verrucosispora sioxanthis TaxID=2499994 RepID=A0A6M1L5T7_9ACTN|nr:MULTISPECIES: nitroreductase family protein [Micromonospora]NEE63984.1 nitroreductase family protein [Verrucosispora sioxanthis]NGM13094.1 nitroreductase family protein [Verrucosispora sioxanthis]WBB51051.1 nitroreductase family protein [Verrucosispora sp. WMMA2044]
MQFAEVIRRRRMVRHYADRPLSPEVIETILASALRAPSAGFSQGWAFLALTDPADRARFWPFVPTRVAQTPTMQNAPLVVVPLAHKAAYLARYAEADKGWADRSEARWPAPYWYIDTGMAALMMLLTAVDEGLDACFFGIMPVTGEYSTPEVDVPAHTAAFKAEFGIPDEYAPIGGICVGYRADDLPPQNPAVAARRRAASTVIHRGQWGNA